LELSSSSAKDTETRASERARVRRFFMMNAMLFENGRLL
jgi:hypothetical protein